MVNRLLGNDGWECHRSERNRADAVSLGKQMPFGGQTLATYIRVFVRRCRSQRNLITLRCRKRAFATRLAAMASLWFLSSSRRTSRKYSSGASHGATKIIIMIIIMEICKRPTYQNMLTAQGAHTSKNSDNILQHEIQI